LRQAVKLSKFLVLRKFFVYDIVTEYLLDQHQLFCHRLDRLTRQGTVDRKCHIDLLYYTQENEKKFGAKLLGKPRMPRREALREIAGLLVLEYGGFWQSFLWFWQFTRNKLRITKFG